MACLIQHKVSFNLTHPDPIHSTCVSENGVSMLWTRPDGEESTITLDQTGMTATIVGDTAINSNGTLTLTNQAAGGIIDTVTNTANLRIGPSNATDGLYMSVGGEYKLESSAGGNGVSPSGMKIAASGDVEIYANGTNSNLHINVNAIVWNGAPIHGTVSDERMKTNITDITHQSAWSRLGKLNPKSYFYKTKTAIGKAKPGKALGFLAHEFKEVYPEAVQTTTVSVPEDDQDKSPILSIDKEHVVADLVAVVQDQQARIEALEKEMRDMKALIKRIMAT